VPGDAARRLTLAKAAKAAGYTCVLQQLEKQTGRLWLVPEAIGTTQPHGCLQFSFEQDSIALAFRDERTAIAESVAYTDGLDEFGRKFQHALTANRVAAPRRKAA
jgi:hypothetical protein